MALTGAAVLIANSTDLGQGEDRPRGIDSDGTNLFAIGVQDRRLIRITDLDTFASEFASRQLPTAINSLAYNDGSFYFAIANHTFYRIDPPFTPTTIEVALSIATTTAGGQIRSLTSDGTNLYAYDRINNEILLITDTGTGVTSVIFATVNFPTGVTTTVTGMFYLDGAFYFPNRGDANLYKLPDNITSGSTVAAVRVGNFTDFDASENNPHGAGTLGRNAYFVGDETNAVYRFYNVRWDETIDAIEVDEGSNGSLDLSTVSQDADSFEFAPSHTVRNWLTISGTELVITNAPDVAADTDFNAEVRAIRDSAHEDKTLTVRVIAEAAPPPPLNPPTFTAPATNYEVNERADDTIDTTEFFTGHTRLAFPADYTPPSWLTISGLDIVITDAPDVVEDTDFTVPLTGTNNDGSVNGSITISVQQIDPAPVFGTPNRFDIDEGGSSVFDLSGDLQHTENLAYQSGYSAPSWLTISGLTLVITNAQQVSQDTDFDVPLTAASTKTAATADRTVTIRVREVTVPPPPPPADAVLDMTVNPASVTAGNAATVTFSFDKAVGEFTDADVNVSAGATKGTLTDEGNNVWTLPVTAPSSGNGTVTVSVGADVVTPGNNADSVQFAYTAPPPPVQEVPALSSEPIEVAVELTPTTALITWKAPTNGAFLTEYEISYAEGASPGTDWIPTESLSTRFVVKRLKRGTQYTWQVRGVTESGAGDASSPVTERTPIASLHNALFFKECVNYFDDGARISEHGNPSNIIRAVGDNNYKTFTREKDLVLNIAVGGQSTRVDAIFVKGIDIEGHSAEPTGGSGVGYSNRRMPSTIKNWEGTDVSTIVNGFSHDLYLLDQHFTATSVRLTFTGTDAKIYEIMLLEFGISIDANGDFLDMNPDFVDREGVVHSDPGGGIAYDSPIGSERDKWQVDYVVRVVPGKTLLETPEEFLYWRAENRNHVFCMEPSRHPARVFPATFVRKSVPIRYRTDSKTSGEILSFRVAEQ